MGFRKKTQKLRCKRSSYEHAKDGWRLVQVIPPYHGAFTPSFEIIFEKKE
ncbi:DUF4177 domain-containing protein [Paenibacillus apiarius]|nr:DUF4177 domain-containing protein [Paenibacillus apiarius]